MTPRDTQEKPRWCPECGHYEGNCPTGCSHYVRPSRDTQELVGAVRSALDPTAPLPVLSDEEALAALTELVERLEAAERERKLLIAENAQRAEMVRLESSRALTAERDLASSQAAALLLHKRVEELERERDKARQDAQEDRRVGSAQLAERDKRIEGLRGALKRIAAVPDEAGIHDPDWPEMQRIARAALADPVVVPGWDDGTWKQEC